MQLIVATRNAHKTREIQRILGSGFTATDLSAHPEIPKIRETGKSFGENAILKAVGASRHLPGLIIADDSGLEVDALPARREFFRHATQAKMRPTNRTSTSCLSNLLGPGPKKPRDRRAFAA